MPRGIRRTKSPAREMVESYGITWAEFRKLTRKLTRLREKAKTAVAALHAFEQSNPKDLL